MRRSCDRRDDQPRSRAQQRSGCRACRQPSWRRSRILWYSFVLRFLAWLWLALAFTLYRSMVSYGLPDAMDLRRAPCPTAGLFPPRRRKRMGPDRPDLQRRGFRGQHLSALGGDGAAARLYLDRASRMGTGTHELAGGRVSFLHAP